MISTNPTEFCCDPSNHRIISVKGEWLYNVEFVLMRVKVGGLEGKERRELRRKKSTKIREKSLDCLSK